MNRVIILGRLGAEPELKFTPSNVAVCNLRVATSEKYKDKNGAWQEKTEWHRVSVFGKQAENCGKYLRKGSQVAVEGSIETRSWEKDGEKRFATEIKAHRVHFCGDKGGGQNAPSEDAFEPPAPSSDDLPF